MANGDLALYHSPEGLFQCTVRSDSDFITLATYNVTESGSHMTFAVIICCC